MSKLEDFKEDLEALCRQYWGRFGYVYGPDLAKGYDKIEVNFEIVFKDDGDNDNNTQ